MDPIFEQFLVPAPGMNPKQRDGAIVQAVPLPAARVEIDVRPATLEDVDFIDALQKMHSHMVGFFHKKTLEKYVSDGNVLIAEHSPSLSGRGSGGGSNDGTNVQGGLFTHPPAPSLKGGGAEAVGYCIYKDQYLKRDDVGIIYQLNVAPIQQRNLIGASLVKSAFERAAYGCKLFCCWCAQDIQANHFWESIGFTPIAFRTGSRAKQRIHIFWQKRIREGDAGVEGTPWWYPYQTQNGAVAEDRIVLPIPPGTHWRDAKPLVLPTVGPASVPVGEIAGHGGPAPPKMLPGGAPVCSRPEETRVKLSAAQRAAIARMQSAQLGGVPLGKKAVLTSGGVKYVERSDFVPEMDVPEELKELLDPEHAKKKAEQEKKEARKKARKPRMKHDSQYVAAARELRDRYLDAVNSGQFVLPEPESKYDVVRLLDGTAREEATARRSTVREDRLLDAA